MRRVNTICPRQIAAYVTAALLFVCLVYKWSCVAVAGSTLATTQGRAGAQTSRNPVQPSARSIGTSPSAAITPEAAETSLTAPRARAYLFRGALGPIFSRGMDSLTEKIQRAGFRADVYEFTICSLIAAAALEDYRMDPAPIILIGHSMGGRCALLFAETLQAEGIPVRLVVTIDPAHMSPDVPLNVEHYFNIFLSKDILGGGDIKPKPGFHGYYASYDLAERSEVSHISIDKMDTIHQQLVAKIMQFAGAPSKADSTPIALRYVVPPDEEIELWDGGMAVSARSRDTLQTLALRYRLPRWSLTQINPVPDNAPLTAGERIIVPRHLAPLTTVSEPLSSRP